MHPLAWLLGAPAIAPVEVLRHHSHGDARTLAVRESPYEFYARHMCHQPHPGRPDRECVVAAWQDLRDRHPAAGSHRHQEPVTPELPAIEGCSRCVPTSVAPRSCRRCLRGARASTPRTLPSGQRGVALRQHPVVLRAHRARDRRRATGQPEAARKSAALWLHLRGCAAVWYDAGDRRHTIGTQRLNVGCRRRVHPLVQ